MNDAVSFDRVRSALEEAFALDPGERQGFLRELAARDPPLYREVEELLALDAKDDTFLDPPQFPAAHDASLKEGEHAARGIRLGPWILLEEIASGGMGTVWRGERADGQFEKQVAIKLIKRGMDSTEVLRRFENERNVLAALEHPNIARLLDGGVSAGGRPYLVMEYVDGVAIDRYVADRALSVRARIELFLAVLDAVASAHRALVVHRDLKPSNILVTPTGMPKLLDFGIAKVLAEGVSDPARTIGGSRPFTPLYASPEQLRDEPITTGTDVWSLGVVLYELLAGRPPFDLSARTMHEIERIICREDPAPPGAGADLDNVVAKAMKKDLGERYASVDAFAGDLRRYLAGMPVAARPDTALYRAARFVRRNRVLVGLATAAVVALIAGTITSTRLYRIAEDAREDAQARADEVRSLGHDLLFGVYDAIERLPGATRARENVVATALSYLDGLARALPDDPRRLRDLADGYLRAGDVQGSMKLSSLGDVEAAYASYQKALGFAERSKALTGDPEDVRRLAVIRWRLGHAESALDRGDAARESYEAALEHARTYAARRPGADADRLVGNVLYVMARAWLDRGRDDEARPLVEQAHEITARLLASSPGEPDYQRDHALVLRALGDLSRDARDLERAGRCYADAYELWRALADRDPQDAQARRGLALVALSQGQVALDRGDADDARDWFLRSLESARERVAADAEDHTARTDLSDAHSWVARAERARGDSETAAVQLERALEFTDDPRRVAILRLDLSAVYSDLGRMDAVREQIAQVRPILLGLVAADPSDADSARHLALAECHAGRAALHTRQPAAAIGHFEQSLDRLEALAARNPDHAWTQRMTLVLLNDLAMAHLARGTDESRTAAERAADLESALSTLDRVLKRHDELRSRGILSQQDDAARDEVEADRDRARAALSALLSGGE